MRIVGAWRRFRVAAEGLGGSSGRREMIRRRPTSHPVALTWHIEGWSCRREPAPRLKSHETETSDATLCPAWQLHKGGGQTMSRNKADLAKQAIDYLVQHDLMLRWEIPEADPPSRRRKAPRHVIPRRWRDRADHLGTARRLPGEQAARGLPATGCAQPVGARTRPLVSPPDVPSGSRRRRA